MRPFIRLVIPGELLEAMIAHARTALPNECCGVLAGRIVEGTARVETHYAIGNDAASTSAYLSNARDLLNALKYVRAADHVVLAFYHSHPTTAPIPSRTDLRDNTWGETVAHVIIGNVTTDPELRAWWLGEREYSECALG
jgi:proteasome lid subunit RPN8/RPN11